MSSRKQFGKIAGYLFDYWGFIGIAVLAIIGLAAMLYAILPAHVPSKEVVAVASVIVGVIWVIVYYSWTWVVLSAVLFFILGSMEGTTAGVAAAFTGALFWCKLIDGSSKPTYRQGVRFGFLAQLAAYPVLFLLSGFLGVSGGLGDIPTFEFSANTPIAELVYTLTYGIVTWLGIHSVGVLITGPLGIAGGLLLVALRRRFPIETDSPTPSSVSE